MKKDIVYWWNFYKKSARGSLFPLAIMQKAKKSLELFLKYQPDQPPDQQTNGTDSIRPCRQRRMSKCRINFFGPKYQKGIWLCDKPFRLVGLLTQ